MQQRRKEDPAITDATMIPVGGLGGFVGFEDGTSLGNSDGLLDTDGDGFMDGTSLGNCDGSMDGEEELGSIESITLTIFSQTLNA
mmetsp:Transcript_8994/g.13616  ORF Transcript_8994/g.13616 Transcript_8994/m.13616 type:complete len:85 (-) Transcript_8994:411-665(-)